MSLETRRLPPPPPPGTIGVAAPGLTREMVAVLDDNKVDKAARRALALLVERGDRGAAVANEICWKLLKHTINKHPVGNPSAFVACCVENAYCQGRV